MVGCSTVQNEKQAFVNHMDFNIGKSASLLWGEPTGKEKLNNGLVKELFQNEGKCSYFVIIDPVKDKIVSWGFINNSEKCKLKTDWFGPW